MGHAVLYRWKLKSGKDEDFVAAWERHAQVLCTESGMIGSRLHKADDGTFVAYSYWPSRKAWEKAQVEPPKSAARALMAAAIDERLDDTHLELVAEQFVDEG
jgi:heme-degrading monooxygenase HmoA